MKTQTILFIIEHNVFVNVQRYAGTRHTVNSCIRDIKDRGIVGTITAYKVVTDGKPSDWVNCNIEVPMEHTYG